MITNPHFSQYRVSRDSLSTKLSNYAPISLPRAFRNFPNVKARKKKYNLSSEIIPSIFQVLSICFPKRINGIISKVKLYTYIYIHFFFVSCFDIGEVPRSPWKWNWNLFYFLPSILTFEQCGSTSKCNSKSPHKNCEAILKVIFRRLNITYSLHGRAIRQPFNLHPDFRESRS